MLFLRPGIVLFGVTLLCAIPMARAAAPSQIARPARIAAGGPHSCAITEAANVRCWGDNSSGELGDGTATSHRVPSPVAELASVVAITAGEGHTCVLSTAAGARCWGSNASGQLGANSPDPCGDFACSLTPIEVTGLASGVFQVAAGFSHTCAVTTNGAVKCWGLNLSGQLGDGTRTERPSPTGVSGLGAHVASVAPGDVFSCAAMDDGTARCWGSNTAGELGNGTTTDSTTAVSVCEDSTCAHPLSDVTVIASGYFHACALTSAGAVRCWGANDSGQLGFASTEQCRAVVSQTCSTVAAPVPSLEHVTAIALAGLHTCALTSGGAVECWGQMFGSPRMSWATPTVVDGVAANIASIAVSDGHLCAVTNDHELLCLGENARGQVGDGTRSNASAVRRVWGLSHRGDSDCDGSITDADAAQVLQLEAALVSGLPCLDSGAAPGVSLSSRDALLVLQYAAGLFD